MLSVLDFGVSTPSLPKLGGLAPLPVPELGEVSALSVLEFRVTAPSPPRLGAMAPLPVPELQLDNQQDSLDWTRIVAGVPLPSLRFSSYPSQRYSAGRMPTRLLCSLADTSGWAPRPFSFAVNYRGVRFVVLSIGIGLATVSLVGFILLETERMECIFLVVRSALWLRCRRPFGEPKTKPAGLLGCCQEAAARSLSTPVDKCHHPRTRTECDRTDSLSGGSMFKPRSCARARRTALFGIPALDRWSHCVDRGSRPRLAGPGFSPGCLCSVTACHSRGNTSPCVPVAPIPLDAEARWGDAALLAARCHQFQD